MDSEQVVSQFQADSKEHAQGSKGPHSIAVSRVQHQPVANESVYQQMTDHILPS